MTKTRYRMSEADRAEYGGEEWVTFDMDLLSGARTSELEAIEREIGKGIGTVIQSMRSGVGSSFALRVVVWIARRQNNLRTPFAEFDLHTLQVESETVTEETAVDPGPLSDSASSSTEPG